VTARGGIEDEDGPFQATAAIVAQVLGGDIAQAKMDEGRLPGVVEPAVGVNIENICGG
jgi:hypothetical protein